MNDDTTNDKEATMTKEAYKALILAKCEKGEELKLSEILALMQRVMIV